MAGIGVWVGGYLADIPADNVKLYLASLAAALICGAGNALNDLLDIEADRLNHPCRPLPGGMLPPYTAILTIIIFNISAVILAVFVNGAVLIAVILSICILFVYNVQLKKVPVWGNLLISILGSATFIAGGLVNNYMAVLQVPGPVVPAAFAFLFHLGRELIKDIADHEGDRAAGYMTLPLIYSPVAVLFLSTIFYAILIGLTVLPIYLGWYRPAYGVVTVVLVDIPLVVLLSYLWASGDRRRFARGGSILKLLMLFGLAAFLCGKI